MLEQAEVDRFRRQIRSLAKRVAMDDPEALAQLHDIVELARAYEFAAAHELHDGTPGSLGMGSGGYSWTEIAAAQGVSRQAMRQRYLVTGSCDA
jgi:hypothetical protein